MNRIYLSSFFLFLTISVFSQKKFDYTWDHYSLVFTLASDFKPVTNNAEEFVAKGDGMEFSIFPFNDNSVKHDDIAAYTMDIAKSIKMEQLDDVDVIELNGLKGAYVEGYKDGDRIITLGFIDPESDTNFFCVITFGDKDKVAEAEAIEMIKSIRKK